MTLTEESVSFPTLDGVTLRGSLYPAPTRGPAIIMTPGFNSLPSMLGLPDVAHYFHLHGYTVLLYSPRNTGASDGSPRHEIDPSQQTSDYSDAVSFFSTHERVNPAEIFIWGISFSASVALCTAALDKRIRAVIAVAPLTAFTLPPDKQPQVLSRCMQDRTAQLHGNEPFYLPMLRKDGTNPAGFGTGIDRERYGRLVTAGRELAPGHVNRTTIQSYYKLIMWQPFPLWETMVAPTPCLWVIPELDQLSPAERQRHYFDKMKGESKQMWLQEGVGHMDVVQGEHLEGLMGVMFRFLENVIQGTL
ncbi:hypothetical protein AtubIFM61612_000791 [Aspergillus tubingensis]|nr:hypothetical protein AtubIFM57143_006846 [Aspergillus tubingensis]GLB13383.1 hypothetical protein AtubIFM61612_000791 [Aspergillus tubingensis]